MSEEVREALERVEKDLIAGTYQVGGWQRCLAMAESLDSEQKRALSGTFTRVSNRLHRRNGFPELPFSVGLLFELTLFTVSMLLIASDNALIQLVSMIALVLCLQPLLKIGTGLLVGVRYEYVYLWYVEPRFKMRFGTYLNRSYWQKVLLQFVGSIGTPVALYVGWRVFLDDGVLAWLFLLGTLAAAAMQIAAFIAAWVGVRKVGPFLLSNLTTPALLAQELQRSPKR